MILKALYDYYYRDKDSIPFGWQKANISFLIVIEKDGSFCRIEDCRQGKKGKDYFVPVGAHNNGISPLLFWDNVQYLLDYTPDYEPLDEIADENKVKTRENKINKSHKKHLSFVERCKYVAEQSGEEELLAVDAFYSTGQLIEVYKDVLWSDIKKNRLSWISFRINGSFNIVAENKHLLNYNSCNDNLSSAICLITGVKSSIVRLCKSTPIRGSKPSAKLVSYNDSSYCSYGKIQGENATISTEAEFAWFIR